MPKFALFLLKNCKKRRHGKTSIVPSPMQFWPLFQIAQNRRVFLGEGV